MRKLSIFVLVFFCFIAFTFAQQPNGGSKPAEPTPLAKAEQRQQQAIINRQRAYIAVVQVDLSDCAKVVAAAAELQKADQILAFAEEKLNEVKGKK